MPKRDREQNDPWGVLVPHNPLCGAPVPLCSPTVVIGREGDVTAPCIPHLSRQHIRLERDAAGAVYATHLSATNRTYLNGRQLARDVAVRVEPDQGNAPFSLPGEAADAPLLFASWRNAEEARAALADEHVRGWCGWTLRFDDSGQETRGGGSAAAAAKKMASDPSSTTDGCLFIFKGSMNNS